MFILKALCILSLGVYAMAEPTDEIEDKNIPLDKTLEPDFKNLQPEFQSFSDPPPPILDQVENPQSSNISIIPDPKYNTTTPSNTTYKFINCVRGFHGSTVQLANDTELIKLLVPDPKLSSEKNAPAQCIAVLFYSKNCPFSSMAAPHFNALQRAFPDIKMVAINAMRYHLFNTQNGIVGVPTLLLFHNGRPIVRYNNSEYNLESFVRFITRHTGIEPQENSVVTSADFGGPVVSSPAKESDMFLIISWLFIVVCSCWYFSKSRAFKWIVETIQRNWRESEQHAQHEHME